MSDLLFEIGCEEIPAGFIDPALNWMAQAIQKELHAVRLTHGKVIAQGTPRRLVLIVHDIAERQPDMTHEVLGPKVEIAFDGAGVLTKAGVGFLRSRNLSEQDVYRKATDKGQVIAAKIEEKGRMAQAVLPELLVKVMREIPFPKTMRWEDSGALFARPVRWLLCLLGNEVLPLEFAGIKASNQTCGHRFMSPHFVQVDGIESYLSHLKQNWVMLDGDERRQAILDRATQLANQMNGSLRQDETLLSTVKNLVEYPWPIKGDFDAKYLEIPKEILISEMREHQKYFAVVDPQDRLLPSFIVVAGSRPNQDADVAAGNARVLRARFEDGAFYFHEDRKRPFEEYVHKLSGVLFQKELGSLSDKTRRIQMLTDSLCQMLNLDETVKRDASRVAQLCKADLVTGVVGQFPELQGVMGREYARLSGEREEVAEGIEKHYWPRFAGDTVPAQEVGAIVGLADRIDTLTSVIGIGKSPKGNADPFALRRAAIGLVRIIVAREYHLSLRHLIQQAIRSLGERVTLKAHALEDEVVGFIHARARGILIEELETKNATYPSLLVDAAMGAAADDLTDLWARIAALHCLQSRNAEVFEQLAATFKRAGNIVAKARAEGAFGENTLWNPDVLKELSELELLREINNAREKVISPNKADSLSQHYVDSLGELAQLKPFVDRFFDHVMVMVDEVALRTARLGLLAELEKMVRAVADFTKIQLER